MATKKKTETIEYVPDASWNLYTRDEYVKVKHIDDENVVVAWKDGTQKVMTNEELLAEYHSVIGQSIHDF